MQILVTGGSGYIGSSVIKRLGGRFSFVNYDIRKNSKDNILDLLRLKKAVKGVDGILHLAAISRPKWGFSDPYHCLTTNIMGMVNVLEALRRVNPRAWIIFGSSREVFAGINYFPADETSLRIPLNAYGVSKTTGEDLVRQYARNYGLRGLTLRFCGVYTGKNDILDRVIPRFISLALRQEPLMVEGRGKRYDYVYIDDVIDAIERAIRYMARQKTGFYDDITLSANSPISLGNLARLIIRLTKSKSKIGHTKERSYDDSGFWGNPAKAKRILGWRPRTTLQDGLLCSIEELKPAIHKARYRK